MTIPLEMRLCFKEDINGIVGNSNTAKIIVENYVRDTLEKAMRLEDVLLYLRSILYEI